MLHVFAFIVALLAAMLALVTLGVATASSVVSRKPLPVLPWTTALILVLANLAVAAGGLWD